MHDLQLNFLMFTRDFYKLLIHKYAHDKIQAEFDKIVPEVKIMLLCYSPT